MSAATLERPTVTARSAGTTRTRQLRPGRGGGRGTRPVARSLSGVGGPAIRSSRRLRVDARGCLAEPNRRQATAVVAGSARSGWQLTDRGIALVLIAGAVLVAAALTVITATAVTVTSQNYHSHGSALAGR